MNKLISREGLNDIINKVIGGDTNIDVVNVDIFHKAFSHKSLSITDNFIDEEDGCCSFSVRDLGSNERLEFLGDSVLNMVTAEYLFTKFPDKDEGFLTKIRTRLVRNTQLSHIGSKLGFNEWILISSNIERIDGRNNPRLIEDVYESFIAALYKDQGFYITREFIFKCFDKYVDLEHLITTNDNHKDILLRYFQLNNWTHPVYTTIKTEGYSKTKTFTVAVLVPKELCADSVDINVIEECDINHKTTFNVDYPDSYIIGSGKSKTKKESEQEASKNALELLKVPKDF